MPDILAYDKVGTVRTSDEDGRLKVSRTPISKANVCEYYGREIPDHQALGLEPEKIYRLYRDAEELEKAAPTFNGLPVLEEHFHANAANPRRDLVVGASGDNAEFKSPYLYNNLIVWDGEAIDRIKTGEQRELSSCYRYRADMTPGVHDGHEYDGVMRDIRGSHIAIVPSGRAGPDVLVADEKLKTDDKPMTKIDELMAALKPFLASDVDAEACKKAMDEFMDDDDDDDGDDGTSSDEGIEEARAEALSKIGYTPDEIAKMTASLHETSSDEDDDEDAEKVKKLTELGYTPDEIAKMCEALKPAASDEDDKDDEEKSRAAMDAAIKSATKAIETRLTNLHRAKSDVASVVGEVAFDTAEQTYGFALKKMGVSLSGVHPTAYRAMFGALKANTAKAKAPVQTTTAMDSKSEVAFLKRFPSLNRIK